MVYSKCITFLIFTPACQLAEAIRCRQVSAVEILDAFLQQTDVYNAKVNAIVTLDTEQAYCLARLADKAIARREWWGLLHGVPITVKDFFETARLRTTCSDRRLANYIPSCDATAVARLRQAGAINLDKTNLPFLAQDFQTDSPLFGRTNNSWNLTRILDSTEGAATTAARFFPLELGGDEGGSIYIPAHCCGVFGLKPTEHRVSTAGLVLGVPGEVKPWRHQVVVGLLGRCVADLKLYLQIIEEADDQDWKVSPAPRESVEPIHIDQLQVAWTDHFGQVSVSAETLTALEKLICACKAQGCCVDYASPSQFDFNLACEVYSEVVGAEIIAAEPGHRRLWQISSCLLSPPWNPEPLVRGFSRDAACFGMRHYSCLLTRRDQFIHQLESFLQHWDVWLCLVMPRPALEHKQTLKFLGSLVGRWLSVDERPLPYWQWETPFTCVFN